MRILNVRISVSGRYERQFYRHILKTLDKHLDATVFGGKSILRKDHANLVVLFHAGLEQSSEEECIVVDVLGLKSFMPDIPCSEQTENLIATVTSQHIQGIISSLALERFKQGYAQDDAEQKIRDAIKKAILEIFPRVQQIVCNIFADTICQTLL